MFDAGAKGHPSVQVKVEWAITERPGKVKALKQRPRKNKAVIQFERLKASIRARLNTHSGSSSVSLASSKRGYRG